MPPVTNWQEISVFVAAFGILVAVFTPEIRRRILPRVGQSAPPPPSVQAESKPRPAPAVIADSPQSAGITLDEFALLIKDANNFRRKALHDSYLKKRFAVAGELTDWHPTTGDFPVNVRHNGIPVTIYFPDEYRKDFAKVHSEGWELSAEVEIWDGFYHDNLPVPHMHKPSRLVLSPPRLRERRP